MQDNEIKQDTMLYHNPLRITCKYSMMNYIKCKVMRADSIYDKIRIIIYRWPQGSAGKWESIQYIIECILLRRDRHRQKWKPNIYEIQCCIITHRQSHRYAGIGRWLNTRYDVEPWYIADTRKCSMMATYSVYTARCCHVTEYTEMDNPTDLIYGTGYRSPHGNPW